MQVFQDALPKIGLETISYFHGGSALTCVPRCYDLQFRRLVSWGREVLTEDPMKIRIGLLLGESVPL